MRLPSSLLGIVLMTAVLVLGTQRSEAQLTPEQECHAARHAEASKYRACRHQAERKIAQAGEVGFTGDSKTPLRYKCRAKYFAAWPKIWSRAFGSGSTCDQPRFTDNGDGTVTDNLTGLQWEQKTDDGGIHDKDDTYNLTVAPPTGHLTNGTAFTDFLAMLNDTTSPGCFAGYCDWRLPTMFELDTIVREPYPDGCTGPCFDTAVFGPASSGGYWASTTLVGYPNFTWVLIGNGYWNYTSNNTSSHVRAVRGGL